MARPKTALTLLAPLTVKKNTGRIEKRLAAPAPRGTIGYAPKHLSEHAKKIWSELIAAAPAQLGANDRVLLEAACKLTDTLRRGLWDAATVARLQSVLKDLGFVTQDRRPVEAAKEKNPSGKAPRHRHAVKTMPRKRGSMPRMSLL